MQCQSLPHSHENPDNSISYILWLRSHFDAALMVLTWTINRSVVSSENQERTCLNRNYLLGGLLDGADGCFSLSPH
jgi:hypothetical protein